MFWQHWQCYILCWGKPRHSVPSLWASALSDVLLWHIEIHKTYKLNKSICMYKMRTTTQQTESSWRTLDCAPSTAASPGVLMHLCVSTGGVMKQSSDLMASLLLYAPVDSLYRRKNKPKTKACWYVQYGILALNRMCV